MESAGYAALQVIPTFKGLESNLEKGTSGALTKVGASGGDKFGGTFATKAGSSIRSKFSETAKYIVAPLVGAFAVEKIGKLIGDSISLASDLNESQNKVQQVFKSSQGEVFKFAASADKALGQTNEQARDAAATFGIFGRAAGLNDQKTAKFSIRMTKLASDLASFQNTSPEQAIEALGAALRGETEPIRAYGVLLNQNALKAEALNIGLLKPVKDQAKIHSAQVKVLEDQVAYNKAVSESGKSSLDAQKAQANLGTAQDQLTKALQGTVPQLSQQQQILAAQSLIMKQTTTQQGDFSRTSGQLANQQRILSASWTDAKAKLGQGLLPVVKILVSQINEHVIPAVSDASDWFSKKGVKSLGSFADEARPLAESLLPAVGHGLKDIGGFLKDAAPAAKATIDAFNSLPDWAQKSIVLGTAGGLLAKKTGLLSLGTKAFTGGGGGGILGEIATTAKPLPVFVVNEGFGGGGKGPAVIGTAGKAGMAAKAAAAEAEAAKAAAAAAAAVRAAGGGVAAQSSAAGRAFKEAMAAHDAALIKGAVDFGIKGGLRGLLGTVLAAPAAISLSHDAPGQNSLFSQIFKGAPGTDAKVGNYQDFLKAVDHSLKSTSTSVDVLKQHVGQASTAIDLTSRRGSQSFGGLSGKIDATSNRTDILDRKLRHLPSAVRTELQFDDREARRRLAAFRAEAQKSLSLEIAGPHMGRPGDAQSALDGVRRR